jgi:hypothetical protein
MTDHRDSFARSGARAALTAATELKQDMAALWTRLGVIELKTAGIVRLGRCGICGEATKGRFCAQHVHLFEGDE